jgi:hypothetical protein
MKLCCVSVDVDGIDHYHAIHGLSAPDAGSAGLVHGLGVERLIAWANELQIPLTWFVVGRDTANPNFVATLRVAIESGHELANHTEDHRYDLVRLPIAQQEVQIRAAQEHLEQSFGHRPVGFRAPGYTVTDTLLDLVEQAGMTYDSSVFPCPAYYAAKALVLAGQRLIGRQSRSILDSPRVLSAPTMPYRRGRPYTCRGSGLVEIPVQVIPWCRFPFIGTTLTSAGQTCARGLARSLVGIRLINLELHPIDLLSAADGLHELARHQPDLRLPLSRKLAALSAVLDTFRKAGYAFVTMAEAIRQLKL